jgi:hypothetical protein
MQHIHFLNSIKTCFGLTRPSSVVIEYSPPEAAALLCQFSGENWHNRARTSGGEYSITTDGGENWHNRARTSGGEYSITDDGRVRPKHVLIEFRK